MVSLAAFKYGNVLAEDGGPVARLDVGGIWVCGERQCLVNAHLHPGLSDGKARPALYGSADGTGVDHEPVSAGYRAISEALERWAFIATLDGPRAAEYGFLEDPSANGMAAFPGLFRRQVRALARADAIQRHAVISWWDGRLPAERTTAPYPGVEALRIHHDSGPGEVVVLFRRTRAGYAYGHAYGTTLHRALRKAGLALARSEHVLGAHRAMGALAVPTSVLERRALYFASEEGAERFGRRLLSRPERAPWPFRVLFDGEIPGPWARWATVWRCCAQMPTDAYLDPSEEFFFW